MYVRKNGDLRPVADRPGRSRPSTRAWQEIAERGGIVAGVLSPFLTVEEAYLLASYLKGLSPANVLALGPVPTQGQDQTFKPDQTKGRTGDTSFVVPRPFTIHAEKCPNRRGVEAVLEHFQGEVIAYDELIADASRRASSQASTSPRTRSTPGSTRPTAKALRSKVEFLVVQDTNVTPLAQLADVVLAGATFAEKAGCYVNADGRLQYSEAALPPRDGSLPDLDLFAILLGPAGRAGPVARRPRRAGRDDPRVRASPRGASFPRSASCSARRRAGRPVRRAAGSPTPGWSSCHKGDRPGERVPKGGKNA